MKKTGSKHVLIPAVVGCFVLFSSCDGKNALNDARKELVQDVGGAPKAKVEAARADINKAEAAIQKNTDAAAAAFEQ